MIRALARRGLTAAILLVAATTAPGALAPGTAWADPGPANARAQARAQVKKAQTEYKIARFDEALEDYSRAYELFPAPALLFNLGQCHRNLKNYERAIFFFEGYLREQPKIDPDQRALTEDLIVESRAALEHENAVAAAVPSFAARPMAAPPARLPSRASAQLALRPQPAATDHAPTLLAVDRRRPPDDTPVTHRWWFWTAIIGTALAAGAVAYYGTGDPQVVTPRGSLGTLNGR